ncbi:MAG: hypothetical protein ABH864_03250 [archaeon]
MVNFRMREKPIRNVFDGFEVVVTDKGIIEGFENEGAQLRVEMHARKGDLEYVAVGNNTGHAAVNEVAEAVRGLMHYLCNRYYGERDIHFGEVPKGRKIDDRTVRVRTGSNNCLLIVDHSPDRRHIGQYVE